jgi:hypothetical protein
VRSANHSATKNHESWSMIMSSPSKLISQSWKCTGNVWWLLSRMWKIKLKVDGGLIRFYKVSLYDIVYTGRLLIYNELMLLFFIPIIFMFIIIIFQIPFYLYFDLNLWRLRLDLRKWCVIGWRSVFWTGDLHPNSEQKRS